jgi:hypothetical protein
MRWEYIVLSVWTPTEGENFVTHQDGRSTQEKGRPTLHEYLNGMGGDGWEVAGTISYGERKEGLVIVKRPR